MNATLPAKWWWKLLSEQDNLWGLLISGTYYARRKQLKEEESFRPFLFWWRSVLTTKGLFKCGTYYIVGDGHKVDWWNDIWCVQTSLRTVYHLIYDKVRRKNVRVRDCWGARGWKWRKILKGFAPDGPAEREMATRIRAEVQAFPTGNDNDEIK